MIAREGRASIVAALAVEEGADGVVRSDAGAAPFDHRAACVERGVHVGCQREAAEQSRETVLRFLSRALGVPSH